MLLGVWYLFFITTQQLLWSTFHSSFIIMGLEVLCLQFLWQLPTEQPNERKIPIRFYPKQGVLHESTIINKIWKWFSTDYSFWLQAILQFSLWVITMLCLNSVYWLSPFLYSLIRASKLFWQYIISTVKSMISSNNSYYLYIVLVL